MQTHALMSGVHAAVALQAGSPEEPVVPSSSPSPGSNSTEGDLIPVVTARQTLSGYSPASFNLLVQQQVSVSGQRPCTAYLITRLIQA